MKKSLIVFVISALAIIVSITAPISTVQAQEAVKPGIFSIQENKYYTFQDFGKLKSVDKIALFKKQDVVIYSGVKVLNLLDVITKTDSQLATAGDTITAFEAKKGINLLSIQKGVNKEDADFGIVSID